MFLTRRGKYMKEKNNLSLEILLLNDLLRTNKIDETIYNMAVSRITAIRKTIKGENKPRVLASA